jgi:hypothetical protein
MGGFRTALGAGTALVIVLGALGLFPVALVAAALLVPTLIVFYLYDVDVYEDEPLLVVSATMLWGAVAGVAIGAFAAAVAPVDASFVAQTLRSKLLVHGFVIPALSMGLVIAVPLLILPHRRFNDVLDGATFGVASGATFVSARVLAQSGSVFRDGLHPTGVHWPWILRLSEIAVALPVVAGASAGAACGAFWLRYRGAAPNRRALGIAGRPLVASFAAVGMLMLSAIGQMIFGAVGSFILLFVLAALVVGWLRRVIHIGLLQEAAEIPIGAEITCANCGGTTPRHTFCRNCGIALRALPKRAVAQSTRLSEEPPV